MWAGDFHDGMAQMASEDLGRPDVTALAPKLTSYGFSQLFEGISPLSLIADGVIWGFIDKTGRVAIEPQYDYTADFSDGLAWVMCFPQIDSDIIDEELLLQLSSIDSASRMEGFWNGFIDKDGNRVLKYDCFEGNSVSLPPARFGDGLVHFKGIERYGYMDRDGNVKIACRFDSAQDFSGGFASIRINDTQGYIDTSGQVLDTPPTDDFSEDLKATTDDSGLYGYVDRTGTFVIPPQFEFAYPFESGIASVAIRIPYTGVRVDAVINKAGEIIWEARHWEPENY